jgi:hypothetical protein
MTTKLEYLKKCINSGEIIGNRNWYIKCFAIPLLKEDTTWESKQLLDIVTKLDGLYYIDLAEDGAKHLVKIVDYNKDTPLFNFQDVIEVDSSWLNSIKTKQQAKIGVVIINAVIFYPSFKTKLEFVNPGIDKRMKLDAIETMLVNRAKNPEEAKDGDILVSEMVDCIGRLSFLSSLSTLVNIAATPKTITPPPGIEKDRARILSEYEGRLNDPVAIVEIENKLTKIDQEYLAGDPAADKVFSSKSRAARKKMYLIYGETKDFVPNENGANVVVPSLSEGIDTSPENFPKYMNDLRYASFSRGASTQYAGYGYKVLQRSLSGLTILKTPCNTTKGFKRKINKTNFNKLVNRYVKNNGWKLVANAEDAKQYIDKEVEMRSTMYCTAPGNNICYQCMSENYKNSPNGMSNLAATISSVLLNMFLKMMHSTTTEITEIKMEDLCT